MGAWCTAVLANAGTGIREERNPAAQKCSGVFSAHIDRGR